MIPFGTNIHDFIKPFLKEIQQLENGGGLGIITADLPQGNNIAEILCHNANHGYRSCYVAKENLTDISFDITLNGRYHQITNI